MGRTGIVLALLAVLVAAWFVWRPDPDIAPPPPDGASAAATGGDATAATAPVPPPAAARAISQDGAWWSSSLTTPDAAVVAADDDDERAGVLRGRLTVRQQPWVHPAGVEVRLTRSWLDSVIPVETEPGVRAPRRDELRTTTDAQGHFAFRLVPPTTELFFLIGHDSDWEDYQKVPKLPRAGEDIDLADVFVDQRGEIVGRVLQHGRPVADATVRAVDDPLLDGTSGFEDLHAARLEGLDAYRVTGTMDGGPIPDWVVRRDRFLPFPTTTSSADGSFRLRGVRPGNHNVLAAAGPVGFRQRGRSDGVLVAAGRTTDLGAITLRSGGKLVNLQFVDEAKQPWIGARIAALASERGFGDEPVVTDARGVATVQLPAGGFRLLFGLPAGGPWLQLLQAPDPSDLTAASPQQRDRRPPAVTLVVPRPRELLVTLVDGGGRLLRGGTVACYVQAQAFRPVDRALPAAMQPRERSPGLHVGQLPCSAVVVASAPGFAPAVGVVGPASPATTLTLLPMQTVTVRVHDLEQRPVAGAAIRARVHGNPELKFPGAQWDALANDRVLVGTTDAAGELAVPVWPSFFSFQARHRDFAPSASPKVLPVPGERIDLLLRGGAEVHGTLTIETRAAPAGLRVRARQRPPPGHDLEKSGFLDERLAVTGDDGRFAFRQLVAGVWDLSPELPGVPTADGARPVPQAWQGRTVQLDEGQELHTTIEIQKDQLAPLQVWGTVTQNGMTIPRALVRIRELDPPALRERNAWRRRLRSLGDSRAAEYAGPDEVAPWSRCETDTFGEFRFRDLTPGVDHELRVDVPQGGRLQFVTRRVVRAGTTLQPLRVDVAILTSDVRLTCLRNGQPVQNRMVRLRQIVDQGTEGARFELLLDQNGEAWVDQLPAGSWTIEPMHGGRCEPATFEVVANQPAMRTFTVLDR